MMPFLDRQRLRPGLVPGACVVLFVLNAYIARELFRVEYLSHMQSVEGSFIAITRFWMEHGFQLPWWPLWNAGMPFQHTYFPLLSGAAALAGGATGWPPAQAFHAVSALSYCLGPITLFLMARGISGRLGASFFAALAYALLSPSALIVPVIAADTDGVWNPRRLHNLAYYGESPHIAALTLLPLAVLFLYLSLQHHRWRHYVAAGVLMAAMVLTNAFAATAMAVSAASFSPCSRAPGFGKTSRASQPLACWRTCGSVP